MPTKETYSSLVLMKMTRSSSQARLTFAKTRSCRLMWHHRHSTASPAMISRLACGECQVLSVCGRSASVLARLRRIWLLGVLNSPSKPASIRFSSVYSLTDTRLSSFLHRRLSVSRSTKLRVVSHCAGPALVRSPQRCASRTICVI